MCMIARNLPFMQVEMHAQAHALASHLHAQFQTSHGLVVGDPWHTGQPGSVLAAKATS